jgi:hypothetical protein
MNLPSWRAVAFFNITNVRIAADERGQCPEISVRFLADRESVHQGCHAVKDYLV